jgi:Zn-finger protein
MIRRYPYLVIITGFLVVLFALFSATSMGLSTSQEQDTPPDANLSIANEVCLSCHGQPGQTYTLQDGSALDLYVPAEAYAQSIHGESGYACVQCHRTVGNYPHPPFQAADLRAAQIQLNETCQYCHAPQFELVNDSVHANALAAGNREAALCIDCHTAHDVRQLNDPQTHTLTSEARVWIPQTCTRCHSAIYELYQDSVHGSALIDQGNPDVPTCIDCHGVHNIPDPTTASFRLSSPDMCGKCHTDSTIVGKYGLSTDVLDTYVADFHGTTVVLFEKQHPEEQTNKPVCYDCHGIHDIARAEDPQKGLEVRQNLLARCQECHPNATDNFPDSWLSHYIPSPEKYPLVYYVDLFYKFFIPGVLGGMGILVAMDFSRMGINRIMKFRQQKKQTFSHITDQPSPEPINPTTNPTDGVQADSTPDDPGSVENASTTRPETKSKDSSQPNPETDQNDR